MCSDAHTKYLSEQDVKRKRSERENADKDKVQREQAAAIKEREKSCAIERCQSKIVRYLKNH